MSIAPVPDYRKSVTRNDYADDPRSGVGRFHILMPVGRYGQGLGDTLALPYDLPDREWSHEQDRIMRRAVRYESLWASAMTASIAQDVGVDFEIQAGKIKKEYYKQMLNFADGGKGWKASFLPHIKKDFQQTNNGMFIELERQSRAFASKITGLHWLDSVHCERTGDPEFPVIYTDRRGKQHIMPAHTVVFAAMNPSSDRDDNGRGECSTAMAWKQICKLAAIERYIYEKVTGKGVQSIEFVVGLDDLVLGDLINAAQLKADQKDADEGRVFARQYMGSILVGLLRDKVQHISIPLKGFPDGFKAQEERGWALNTYANAAGIDPQVLAPLIGGELGGTSRQSETLQQYRDQRAGVLFKQTFTHMLNDWILPMDSTLFFVTQDLQQRKNEAEVKQLVAQPIYEALDRKLLTGPQAQAMLADNDIIAKEYVDPALRPMDGLSEHEKNIEVDQQPTTPEQQQDADKRATKAVDPLTDDAIAAAASLFDEIQESLKNE